MKRRTILLVLLALGPVAAHTQDGPPAHGRGEPQGNPADLDFYIRQMDFLADARRAGLEAAAEPGFLPYQYFVILKPPAGR